MLVLAVDTSARMVTAAVVEVASPDDVRAVAAREHDAPNRHGELLAPLVHEALTAAGVTPHELDAVAAGLGPGPFTGLRVGVVTATTMADALGIPVYGACSLDALALRHTDGHDVVVCTDARRRQVYWASYDGHGNRVGGPELAPATDVAAASAGDVHVAGLGAALYPDAFSGFLVHDDLQFATAVEVARVVAAKVVARAPSDVMEPLYLRRPDAAPPAAPKAVTPR